MRGRKPTTSGAEAMIRLAFHKGRSLQIKHSTAAALLRRHLIRKSYFLSAAGLRWIERFREGLESIP